MSEAHGSRGQNEMGATPISLRKVIAAAKAGVAAAATKAKLFADHGEREIQSLSANLINQQLKRLELKLKQFAELETFLMKECEQVERQRQRVITERAHFISTWLGPTGVTSPMSLPGVGPSMVNNIVVGSKLCQLHLQSPAYLDIAKTNHYIPTCNLFHNSICLDWGQGCP